MEFPLPAGNAAGFSQRPRSGHLRARGSANKSWVERNFGSAKGNLYDAGAGLLTPRDLPRLGTLPPIALI
jgi:hypothetical protein